jgi:hypothetical protein
MQEVNVNLSLLIYSPMKIYGRAGRVEVYVPMFLTTTLDECD